MKELSAAGLADLAGVTEPEVARMVELGILVPRGGAAPFLETDVQKVRLAVACEQAGLPMAGIASAIQAGRLSFGFLEAAPFRRWAVRSTRTWAYQARFEGQALESGADERTAMELAAQLGGDFLPVEDPAQLGVYRRQQDRSGSRRCRSST